MKTLLTLFVFCLTAQAQFFGPPVRFREVYHSPGAGQSAFPSGVSAGYTVTVIDGDSANPCTTGGGSTKSQCRYSGSAWQPVGPASSGGGSGDVSTTSTNTMTGYTNFVNGTLRMPEKTVSGLPSAASNTGKVFRVTDGAGTLDCTTGGGSFRVLCYSTGSAWAAELSLSFDSTLSLSGATLGVNTAVVQTRANHQSGATLRCAASDADDAYDCAMTPALQSYTDGMVVEFEATVTANTGSATLQIDSLAGGGRAIKLCDGSTDPATGDIAVGKQVPLRYDGTVFRLPCNPATLTGVTAPLTYRTCSIVFGSDNGSALANADLGPQGRICLVPVAATVTEVTVAADAGTPNIIVRRNRAGTGADFVTSALATAASGGLACSKTSAVTGLDGATTCSATLQNTGLNAGDWIEAISGTAGGTAKRMSVAVTYTVN